MQVLDIFGRPKRNFIEMLGLLATAPDEKEALHALVLTTRAPQPPIDRRAHAVCDRCRSLSMLLLIGLFGHSWGS